MTSTVQEIPTPRPTPTWTTIPHMDLIHNVEKTLSATNLVIASAAHSLTHDGARYFGLMEIQSQMSGSDDYCWVLGLRNSHDKTFPAGTRKCHPTFRGESFIIAGLQIKERLILLALAA